MELAFQDKNIRSICEDQDVAKQEFGDEGARKLHIRLADIRAAPTVNDLIAGRPEEIAIEKYPNCYKLDLHPQHRLVFCANHVKVPLKGAFMDWSKVSRVKIVLIQKYNE